MSTQNTFQGQCPGPKLRDFLTLERWTCGNDARDMHGQGVEAEDTRACKWCLAGAVRKVYGDLAFPIHLKVSEFLADNNLGVSLRIFNDTHTYEEVMEVVKECDV